jgi:KDO2-lipid IV(A) lauroyltransferase
MRVGGLGGKGEAMEFLLNQRYLATLFRLFGRLCAPPVAHPVEALIINLLRTHPHTPFMRAARANQWVIHGGELGGEDLERAAWSVMRHAVHSLLDLNYIVHRPEALARLLPLTPRVQALINRSQEGREGLMVVLPHVSNFDLALMATAQRGLRARLLTLATPSISQKIQNRQRAHSGLEVSPISPAVVQQGVEYMRRGGVVITAVDRPVPGKERTLDFFGHPAPLPVGHVRMAMAADVPVVVIAISMLLDGSYRLRVSDPLPMTSGPDRVEAVRQNAQRVLQVLEPYIRRTPRQWLMFHPVWPTLPVPKDL